MGGREEGEIKECAYDRFILRTVATDLIETALADTNSVEGIKLFATLDAVLSFSA